jgi:hypothetical protein
MLRRASILLPLNRRTNHPWLLAGFGSEIFVKRKPGRVLVVVRFSRSAGAGSPARAVFACWGETSRRLSLGHLARFYRR